MKSRRSYFLFILWAILLIGCNQRTNKENNAEGLSKAGSLDKNETGKTEKEDLISRIRLSGLDGEGISLEQYRGKTVFLNFWATWCKPCLEEMPSIESAKGKLPDRDFVFLAASDEDLEKIKKFKSRHDYTFQFVLLESDFPDIDIYSLPTTLIINSSGEIVMKKSGALDWNSPEMIRQLKEIAGGN